MAVMVPADAPAGESTHGWVPSLRWQARHPYAVEYVLVAEMTGGRITEVIELLDTVASEQHAGNPVGVPPGS